MIVRKFWKSNLIDIVSRIFQCYDGRQPLAIVVIIDKLDMKSKINYKQSFYRNDIISIRVKNNECMRNLSIHIYKYFDMIAYQNVSKLKSFAKNQNSYCR